MSETDSAGGIPLPPHIPDPKGETGTSGGGSTVLRWILKALGVLLVLVLIGALVHKTRPKPLTPTERIAALHAVRAALARCAEAASTSPPACPQQGDVVGDVSGIVWRLYGEPTRGAQLSGSLHGGGDVRGVAIYTLRFDNDTGKTYLQVVPTPYDAQISWRDNGAVVTALQADSEGGIIVPRPAWRRREVERAVVAVLRSCLSHVSYLCPWDKPWPDDATAIRGRFDRNPLAADAMTYDDQTGIVHLVGTYAISGSYTESQYGRQTFRDNGNYDAQLAGYRHRPRVLTITGG
jgi:hypothetical protein